jgi:hypothetical protein
MADEKTVEQRASEMGWSPKEQWRGDPERWIDAETFVKRGEELMPILKANNRRLQEEVGGLRSTIQEQMTIIKANQEAIEALREFNSAQTLKEVKQQKTLLTREIVKAREENDLEREQELQEQLDDTREAIKAAEAGKGKKTEKSEQKQTSPNEPVTDPDFKAWHEDNAWFGSDPVKTGLANGVAAKLRQDPETKNLLGRAFLDKVSEGVDKILGNERRDAASKVDGGRGDGGGSGGSNSKKSFSDLPADAKQACESQATRLVGKGRAFPDITAWRKHYVEKYFQE